MKIGIWMRTFVALLLSASGNVAWPSTATATWSTTPYDLTPDQGDYTYYDTQKPQMAASVDGSKAIAVWVAPTNKIISRSAVISGSTSVWSDQVSISSPGYGERDDNPSLAISSDGTIAIAAWARTSTSGSSYSSGLKYSLGIKKGDSFTWMATSDVASDSMKDMSKSISNTLISISRDGSKATLIWSGCSASPCNSYIVQSASAIIGGGVASWGSIKTLFTSPTYSVEITGLNISDAGDKALASFYSYKDRVNLSSFSIINGNSADWGNPAQISTISYTANIALLNNGSAASAIWVDDSSPGSNYLYLSMGSISGNSIIWGNPSKFSDGDELVNPGAQIASSRSGGRALVSWLSYGKSGAPEYSLRARLGSITDKGSQWGDSVEIGRLPMGQSPTDLQARMSDDGAKGVVLWNRPNIKASPLLLEDNLSITPGVVSDIPGPTQGVAFLHPHLTLSADGTRSSALWVLTNGIVFWVNSSTSSIKYINSFQLTITSNGSGLVSSDPAGINCGVICKASFNENTTVNLAAIATPGYKFTGWSGACSGVAACSVTMTSNQGVTANFEKLPEVFWTLKVTRSPNAVITSEVAKINCGGKVRQCSGSVQQGTVLTLTAAPKVGYFTKIWKGCTSASGNSCNVLVGNSNMAISAIFAKKK